MHDKIIISIHQRQWNKWKWQTHTAGPNTPRSTAFHVKEQSCWTAKRELIAICQKEKLGWAWLWTGVVGFWGCKSIWSDSANGTAQQISYILSNGGQTVSISIIYYSPGAYNKHKYILVLSTTTSLWEMFGTSFNWLRAQMEYFQPCPIVFDCKIFILACLFSFFNQFKWNLLL